MKIAQSDPFMYVPKVEETTTKALFAKTFSEWAIYGINLFTMIVLSVSVISIVMAGIKYTMAKGDVKAAQGAQQTLIYSIFAFGGTIVAYTLFRVMVTTLGVEGDQLIILKFLGI